MKKWVVLLILLFISVDAMASVTAEQAYDIARTELFPTDQKADDWYILRNETPWTYYEKGPWTKPYEYTQIESKLKDMDYWAVVFRTGEVFFYFYIDTSNGKIIASEPSHDNILKYYTKRKGYISMDAAIAIADKEVKNRSINAKKYTLKIKMVRTDIDIMQSGANSKQTKFILNNICSNYSTIAQLRQISIMLPSEHGQPTWEIDYRIREENKVRRDIVVLIDAITGEVIDYRE